MSELFGDICQDDSLILVACDRKKVLFLKQGIGFNFGPYFILDLQHKKLVINFFLERDAYFHTDHRFLKISKTKQVFTISNSEKDDGSIIFKYNKIDLKTAQINHIRTDRIQNTLDGGVSLLSFLKKLNSKSLAVVIRDSQFEEYFIFHQKYFRKIHEINKPNQFRVPFFTDDRFFLQSKDNYFLEFADLSFRVKNLGNQKQHLDIASCTSNREKSHFKLEGSIPHFDKILEVREENGLKLVSRFERKTQPLKFSSNFVVLTWKRHFTIEEKIYFDDFNLALFRDFRIKTKVQFRWRTVAEVDKKQKIKALIAAKVNEFYLTFNEKKHRRLILKKGV